MKSENGHTGWLSALLNWIKGESTLQDERALEDLASKDEFLADALEGYRKFPKENHAAAITRMKVQLRKRTKKRGMVFYAVRAAAAVAFLVVAWLVVQNLLPPSETGSISMMEKQESVDVQAPPETVESIGTQSSQEEVIAETNQDVAENTTRRISPPISAKEDLAVVTQKQKVPEDPPTPLADLKTPETPAIPKVEKPVEEIAVALQKEKMEAKERFMEPGAIRMAPKAMTSEPSAGVLSSRKISGKVTGQNGEPIIGATVLQKGTNKGAVTDFDGNFSLEVIAPAPLSVSYIGYQTREISMDDRTQYIITLTEAMASELSEVVVTGLSDKKAKARREATKSPEPENGFKSYEKYLSESLIYPPSAKANDITGKVRLQFRVNPDGSLSDFIVLDSLGFGCDEEAIRLLKEGPKWKPAGMQNYSVAFRLK